MPNFDLLNLFRHTEGEKHASGEILFNQGDVGHHMYLIKKGQIALKHGQHILETLTEGAIFGEMALIDNEMRSATAQATVDSELIAIDEKRFQFLVSETPFFAQYVMKVMANRLRKMNAKVSE